MGTNQFKMAVETLIGPLAVYSFEDNKAIGMKAMYSSQALESLAHSSAKV
jgi:hypothetical protein